MGAFRRLNEPVPAHVQVDPATGLPAHVSWSASDVRGPRARRAATAAGSRRGRARGAAGAGGGTGAGGGIRRRRERVERVLDTWLVDDGWWTERPVRRAYHEVVLDSGACVVLAHDLAAGGWYLQR